jgi:hypothetical protein
MFKCKLTHHTLLGLALLSSLTLAQDAEGERPQREGAERPQAEGQEAERTERPIREADDEVAERPQRERDQQKMTPPGRGNPANRDAVLGDMKDAEVRHRERLAMIGRLREIAAAKGQTQRLEALDKLEEKEFARYERVQEKHRKVLGDDSYSKAEERLSKGRGKEYTDKQKRRGQKIRRETIKENQAPDRPERPANERAEQQEEKVERPAKERAEKEKDKVERPAKERAEKQKDKPERPGDEARASGAQSAAGAAAGKQAGQSAGVRGTTGTRKATGTRSGGSGRASGSSGSSKKGGRKPRSL